MRVTLAIAGRTLFDADVDGDANDVAETLELSMRMFNRSILPLGVLFEYAPLPWVRDLHRARRRMDALIHRIHARVLDHIKNEVERERTPRPIGGRE